MQLGPWHTTQLFAGCTVGRGFIGVVGVDVDVDVVAGAFEGDVAGNVVLVWHGGTIRTPRTRTYGFGSNEELTLTAQVLACGTDFRR